jgi:hypothetical protein
MYQLRLVLKLRLVCGKMPEARATGQVSIEIFSVRLEITLSDCSLSPN